MISMRSSRPSASKPHDNTGEREKNPHYAHYNGLNQKRNAKNAPLISLDAGRVKARVIRTDEELMIARSTTRVLNLGSIRET